MPGARGADRNLKEGEVPEGLACSDFAGVHGDPKEVFNQKDDSGSVLEKNSGGRGKVDWSPKTGDQTDSH